MVMAMRHTFDFASGYTIGRSLNTLDERAVLVRCIFLETVAGKLLLLYLTKIDQIDFIIILMKNLKNEKKPLYNEEKRTILTPSYFRGNRGSYEGSILSVFPSYITVFSSF